MDGGQTAQRLGESADLCRLGEWGGVEGSRGLIRSLRITGEGRQGGRSTFSKENNFSVLTRHKKVQDSNRGRSQVALPRKLDRDQWVSILCKRKECEILLIFDFVPNLFAFH